MDTPANEVDVDKKSSKVSSKRSRLSSQLRRSQKSLSTIIEEPKSVPTVSSKTESRFQTSPQTQPHKGGTLKNEGLRATPQEITSPKQKKQGSLTKKSLLGNPGPSSSTISKRSSLASRLTGPPLFPTVIGDSSSTAPSILVTGFGLRNLASLQEALQLDEQNRLKQIYRTQEAQEKLPSVISSSKSSLLSKTESSPAVTQTQSQTELSGGSARAGQLRLEYLLGLSAAEEESEAPPEKQGAGVAKEEETGTTEAMRRAQKYLRVHKIFEFFQFITCHLLSALPDNPIEFIIDLLDKCLLYRSGLGEPPVLYNKKHLEVLFYLMDKMRTGYIEVDQYRTGMRTIGICSYKENPPLSKDGMVAKEFFIEEAYDCLSNLLNDVCKRHWLSSPPPSAPPPPPSPQISTLNTSASCECSHSEVCAKTHLFFKCRHRST